MTTNAIATLTAAFDATFTSPGYAADRDRPAVVLSWPSVPIEIVRAAGLRPFFVRGGAISTAATPAADAHLEPEIFPSRLRQPRGCGTHRAALDSAARIIVPRTSDPDYKTLPLSPRVCAPGHRALASAQSYCSICCSRTVRTSAPTTRHACGLCSMNSLR